MTKSELLDRLIDAKAGASLVSYVEAFCSDFWDLWWGCSPSNLGSLVAVPGVLSAEDSELCAKFRDEYHCDTDPVYERSLEKWAHNVRITCKPLWSDQ